VLAHQNSHTSSDDTEPMEAPNVSSLSLRLQRVGRRHLVQVEVSK
jgi:hypothetical protein